MPRASLGFDPLDLMVIAIDQCDPLPPVLRVPPLRLIKHPAHDHRGVLDDAGHRPLVASLGCRLRDPLWPSDENVGGRARDRGHVVHTADLRHPFAVALLAFGQPRRQLGTGPGRRLAGLLTQGLRPHHYPHAVAGDDDYVAGIDLNKGPLSVEMVKVSPRCDDG